MNCGHIYVVLFNTGWLKVGYSANPEQRLEQHRKEAKRHGNRVYAAWVSDYMDDARSAEKDLISFASSLAEEAVAREYFAADFKQVVAYAAGLAGGPNEYHYYPIMLEWPKPFCAWIGWNRMLTKTDFLAVTCMADLPADSNGVISITGAELAEIIGVSALTASKSLTRMHRNGVLEKKGNGRYRIRYERGSLPDDSESQEIINRTKDTRR